MAENVLTVTWRWPWTVHAGWCDFAIVEMNTKSRKLCKIRRSLQFFSKLAQIFSRFGPRRVMWHMYHNTHQDNTLVDSRASGVSTAERSHSRTNIAVKGRAEQFRAISQIQVVFRTKNPANSVANFERFGRNNRKRKTTLQLHCSCWYSKWISTF